MRTLKRLGWMSALVALAATAGCASRFGGFSMGPGLNIGLGLGLGGPSLQLVPTSCLLLGSTTPAAYAVPGSAAAVAGARMQQVAQVQSSYSLSSSAGGMESWKRLAAGGC